MICCYSINVLSSKIPAETASSEVKKSQNSRKIEDIYLFSNYFSLFLFFIYFPRMCLNIPKTSVQILMLLLLSV